MNSPVNPRMLYVLGDARSGSTLLSIALGHALGAGHGGELKNAAERAWIRSEVCSCGLHGTQCPHWQKVRRSFADTCGEEAPEELAELQTTFDRLRGLPAAWLARLTNSKRWQRYCTLNAAFLSALAQADNTEILIDNSKNIARALSLQAMPGTQIRFVHTTRDPRGAAWSQARYMQKNLALGINRDRQPLPAWRVSLAWCFNNLAPIMLKSGSVLHVSYETFVEDPDRTMEVCANHLCMNPTSIRKTSNQSLDARPQHIISGNRLRMQTDIRIASGSAWAKEIPAAMARRTWLMTGWLARRFGYERTLPRS